VTKSDNIQTFSNNQKIFDDLEIKLEEYIKHAKTKSNKSEKQNNLLDFMELYSVYKIFSKEIISSFPESQKLVNKILHDFDGIILNLSANFKDLSEKLDNSKKKISSKINA